MDHKLKYTLITLDPRQEVITKLNFQDWINFKIGGQNTELHTSEY